jgi:hypothetical protein
VGPVQIQCISPSVTLNGKKGKLPRPIIHRHRFLKHVLCIFARFTSWPEDTPHSYSPQWSEGCPGAVEPSSSRLFSRSRGSETR